MDCPSPSATIFVEMDSTLVRWLIQRRLEDGRLPHRDITVIVDRPGASRDP